MLKLAWWLGTGCTTRRVTDTCPDRPGEPKSRPRRARDLAVIKGTRMLAVITGTRMLQVTAWLLHVLRRRWPATGCTTRRATATCPAGCGVSAWLPRSVPEPYIQNTLYWMNPLLWRNVSHSRPARGEFILLKLYDKHGDRMRRWKRELELVLRNPHPQYNCCSQNQIRDL